MYVLYVLYVCVRVGVCVCACVCVRVSIIVLLLYDVLLNCPMWESFVLLDVLKGSKFVNEI